MRKNSWNRQLVAITERGAAAFRRGEPKTANPYLVGERGHGIRNPGGNLQQQRAEYWLHGWRSAMQQSSPETSND